MLDQHLIAPTRPYANEKNIVYWRDYRVTVLQDRLFRVEKSAKKKFRDSATQAVWFRDMPEQKFDCIFSKDFCKIRTLSAILVLKPKKRECFIELDGKKLPVSNEGNLKGTHRTLDGSNGRRFMYNFSGKDGKFVNLGAGVCSKTGVAVLSDQNSLTLADNGELLPEKGNGTDEYLFVYGNDYRSSVKALYLITGSTPLIPRYALGNWWSRYHAYTQEEYIRLLNRFEENEIPLTVATIDMDWHWSNAVVRQKNIEKDGRNDKKYTGGVSARVGWTGYSWNTELFPNYKEFLRDIRSRDLKITLNLHPADGVRYWEDQYEEMATAMGIDPTSALPVRFNIADSKFVNNYFKILHKPFEDEGVDFWWIDWQQGDEDDWGGIDPLWSLNHYHYLDNAVNHFDPLILSRYSGVGSHRYPLGFSGDTATTWNTLRYLPEFTSTATNIGYTWWSHDIGGHGHKICEDGNELIVRHLQYGVFSPINRIHGSPYKTMIKEPWYYTNGAGFIIADMMRFRHKLIPFLYSASFDTYKNGKALIEPLYYEWKQEEAYKTKNEYLFGKELLVIPITTKLKKDGYARVNAWLPEGEWTDIFTGDKYFIKKGGEYRILLRNLESIPVLIKSGGILPLSIDKGNAAENPKKLEVCVWSGNGEYTLYEDGRTKENTEEHFTKFYTETISTNLENVQTLTIRCKGNCKVIPENRIIRVSFKDITEGKAKVIRNGKEIDFKIRSTDCLCVEFDFAASCEYQVEVTTPIRTILNYLKERAKQILLRAEGDLEFEKTLLNIVNSTSVIEYANAVDNSPIPSAVKSRLKETL